MKGPSDRRGREYLAFVILSAAHRSDA